MTFNPAPRVLQDCGSFRQNIHRSGSFVCLTSSKCQFLNRRIALLGNAECAALPSFWIIAAPFDPIAKSLSVGSPFIRYSHFAPAGVHLRLSRLKPSSSTV
jgi:hypothetical protein